jgi:2,4-dienoyl-CoA reductase (NADPH2)
MHGRFSFKSGLELLAKGRELGLDIPFSDDLSPLTRPFIIDGFTISNRFVVHPMEGYDAEHDGTPSSLTVRRYRRYAEGGSGIIWIEAVAVSPEGRSNPGQLLLNRENLQSFKRLVEEIKRSASESGFNPFIVIQLTHSGRYSNPSGNPEPVVAGLNPLLDKTKPHILTDDELVKIQDKYVEGAILSKEAGFDAVDVKACHGYLVIDSLSSKHRMNSIYGGPLIVNRFRFMLETIDRIIKEADGMMITTRLNISDCYSGGFGTGIDDGPDFTEPILLTEELFKRGIRLVSLSMGSPYHNPFVTRPLDTPIPGRPLPGEHPLQGVMRMITGTSLFQKRFPEISFVGSAYSWLRHYAPNVGASVISDGGASFIGFGRNSFAYPSMPADIIRNGRADPSKFCITCSGCSRLISNFRHGGCVIRDKGIYGAELKKLISNGK